eukprot:SAG31_NODE_22929_length_515_cov_0.740385_1_plen_57_part_10
MPLRGFLLQVLLALAVRAGGAGQVGPKYLLIDPRVVDATKVHAAEIAMGSAIKHGPP